MKKKQKKPSLKKKFLVSCIICLLLQIIFYGFLLLFVPGFYQKKTIMAELNGNLTKIKNLQADDNLNETVSDYAHWDEIYKVASEPDKEWLEKNLTDWVPQNFDVQLIIGINNRSESFYTFNQTKKIINEQDIAKIFQKTSVEGEFNSYFSTPEGVIIFSASPITKTGDGSGKPNGALVFGRIMDKDYWQKISNIFGLPINFSSSAGSIDTGSGDFTGINFDSKLNEEDKKFFYSSYFLNDIYGQPIAKITLEEQNNPFSQAIEDTTFWLVIADIFGLLLVIFYGIYIYKSVSDPLIQLSNALTEKGEETPRKIILNGKIDKEISVLAEKFNGMINKIAEKNILLTDKNKRIKDQNTAMLNILEDVTNERNKIAKEKDKIDTILKSIGDGVIVTDKERKVIIMNPAGEEITGFAKGKAVGLDAEIVLNIYDEKTNQKRRLPIDDALETGKKVNLANHTILKRKDGANIPIADSAAPIKDAEGKIYGAVMVFRDVVKEKLAEKKMNEAYNKLDEVNKSLDAKIEENTRELRKAYEELKSLDAMKDEFLNISAHELKTPLTSIIGLTELILLKKQGAVNTKQTKSLKIVNDEATRLLGIIKKILSITRIEAKKTIFNIQNIDLCKILPTVVESLKQVAASAQINIACQRPQKSIMVKADPERVQEVVYNLIDNAIKFSPPHGKIYVSGKVEGKEFIFGVKDEGPGIDPDKKDLLFQKFSQLDTGFSRKQEGTGLGLYICKIIIENMGGKIWVESEKNKGAEFKFSLPLAKK